jgi:AraC-like DNA-binding protein
MYTKHFAIVACDLRYWKRQGIDLCQLLTEVGLPPGWLRNPPARVEGSVAARLYQRAGERLRDPAMGVHIGQQMFLPDIAVIGEITHYFRDGWQALDAVQQCWPLLSEVQLLSVHRCEDRVAVRIAPVDPALVHPMQTHSLLSGFIRLASVILGIDVARDMVLELREEGSAGSIFSECLGLPVTQGAEHDQLHFPAKALDATNPRHDERRFQQAFSQGRLALNNLQDSHFLDTILALLHQQIQHGEANPSQKQLAENLHMSVRNFQRRLNAHNARFRDLLDQVREHQARRWVAGSSASFTDIAHRLGYGDTASFYKAFKRWAGQPPGEYRLRNGQGSP